MEIITFEPQTSNILFCIPVLEPFRQIPGIHIAAEPFDQCDEIQIIEPYVESFLVETRFPQYLRRKKVFDHVLNQPEIIAIDKGTRWKKILVGRIMATWGYRAPSNSSREYVRRLGHGQQ